MALLTGLDLFSGIGGISLALSEWVRTIAYCEIEPYCQGVLLSRMADGILDNAPIWDDIKTLDGKQFEGKIDIIFGGFPCTDISYAGLGKGLEGERSGLFFEIMRLAEEIEPKFIFLENVPAICSRGGLQVVREIAERGLDCRWCTLSAAEVGAKHRRERWFLLAYSNDSRNRISECNLKKWKETFQDGDNSQFKFSGYSTTSSYVAHSQSKRCEEGGFSEREKEAHTGFESVNKHAFRDNWETDEPCLVGMVDRVQFRSHRIKAIGNSVVPLQVRKAFQILSGISSKDTN